MSSLVFAALVFLASLVVVWTAILAIKEVARTFSVIRKKIHRSSNAR